MKKKKILPELDKLLKKSLNYNNNNYNKPPQKNNTLLSLLKFQDLNKILIKMNSYYILKKEI